ncbi:hypothetical protein VTL71DRAFT_9363 [Oculimacula yallundae]|uniref:Uncharacterized protein n=1 Tax=Oculimacula yallundae TaxID=86028 RepID=A0ABR4BTM6_9HELO
MKRTPAVVAIIAFYYEVFVIQALASSTVGIGFELTLNYGTTAVAFANGTTVPVARIEGGPAYKAEMRRVVAESLTPTRDPTFLTKMISSTLKCLQFLNIVEKPLLESPWKGMLSALKMSTEVFLEREIQTVDIVLPVTRPYSIKRYHQAQDLDRVLQSVGLSRLNEQSTRSSIATCYANNLTSLSDIASPDFVLAVDYSRTALILSLENLEIGLLEVTKITVHFDLGAGSISKKRGYWKRVENEMLKLIRGVSIRHVVLSGDQIQVQPGLGDVIKKVVPKKVLQKMRLGMGGTSVDPVWAGAFGVARMATQDDFEGVIDTAEL